VDAILHITACAIFGGGGGGRGCYLQFSAITKRDHLQI
jgi:hypothetical protein